MACILRIPNKDSVGVITITSLERDKLIKGNEVLRKKLTILKKDWLIGLHHNWHDWQFNYDSLFDFSMAGDGDLVEINGVEVPTVNIDACNFVPNSFYPSQSEKFWDILYVARAVYFKKIPEFFKIIRALYDSGRKYRVLFICPMPPYNRKDKNTVFYQIRREYENLFSEAEQKLFNLLTIDYMYPFPFDLNTLGYFYRSSKVFVHTADDERRCRVAAYAWASGLPVIAKDCVASLLPEELRAPPYLFMCNSYDDFCEKIVSAIDGTLTMTWNSMALQNNFSEDLVVANLDYYLAGISKKLNRSYVLGKLMSGNLSLRLGRHNFSQRSSNSVGVDLENLIDWLLDNKKILVNLHEKSNPEDEIYTIVDKESSVTVSNWFSMVRQSLKL